MVRYWTMHLISNLLLPLGSQFLAWEDLRCVKKLRLEICNTMNTNTSAHISLSPLWGADRDMVQKSMSKATKTFRPWESVETAPVRIVFGYHCSGFRLGSQSLFVTSDWSVASIFSELVPHMRMVNLRPVMDFIFSGVCQGVAISFAIDLASSMRRFRKCCQALHWARLHPWCPKTRMRHKPCRNRLGCPVHTSFSSILKTSALVWLKRKKHH